jgi:hypothetical protein
MKPSFRRIALSALVLSVSSAAFSAATEPVIVQSKPAPEKTIVNPVAVTPTVVNGSAGLKVRHEQPRPLLSPIPLGGKLDRIPSLQFLTPDQMSSSDRSLAEGSQDEIARRAGLQGFGPGVDHAGNGEKSPGGAWDYEQAVCPVFPDHLVLEYSRDNGEGDITLFSAVVPRGEGHVRVIPVRRRSYSLWTPAPKNELTINDFNHIVREEGRGLGADWLTLGLCYAALAGGHVRAQLQALTPAEEHFPLFTPAKLTVSYNKGGAEVQFSDATPHVKAMTWVMTFDASGRLLKVKHEESSELVERRIDSKNTEVWKPTKQAVVDVK